MQDVGNLAEWVGSIATAVSVLVAVVVFAVSTRDSQRQSRLNWKPHLAFPYPNGPRSADERVADNLGLLIF
jgi:hypothetical protein